MTCCLLIRFFAFCRRGRRRCVKKVNNVFKWNSGTYVLNHVVAQYSGNALCWKKWWAATWEPAAKEGWDRQAKICREKTVILTLMSLFLRYRCWHRYLLLSFSFPFLLDGNEKISETRGTINNATIQMKAIEDYFLRCCSPFILPSNIRVSENLPNWRFGRRGILVI